METSDENYAGTYTIVVIGTLEDFGSYNYSFVLEVNYSCSVAEFANSNQVDFGYAVNSGEKTFTLIPFDYSVLVNEPVVYTLTFGNGSDIDTSLLSFNSLFRTISISTHDYSLIGSYTLTLKGRV